MKDKQLSDWDRFFRIVQESDPYGHLRSIHNGICALRPHQALGDARRASRTSGYRERHSVWRERYSKPVVFDECAYEGNIPQRWGNITGEEMVHRFWEGTVQRRLRRPRRDLPDPTRSCLVVKGGTLHGESAPPSPSCDRYSKKALPRVSIDSATGRVSLPSSLPPVKRTNIIWLIRAHTNPSR